MKKVSAFILALCASVGTAYAFEVAVPSDLKLEQPTAEVPPQCASFFSSGGWGEGKWDEMRPGHLWVEKIYSDCTVKAVYSYGSWPGRGDAPGYFRVEDGKIVDSVLTIAFKVNQSLVTVTYRFSDESLRGLWRMEGRKNPSTIRLKRLASQL